MRRSSAQPGVEWYSLIVAALTRAGRQQEAERWMRRVVQPKLSQLTLQRAQAGGAKLNLSHYNRVLAAYVVVRWPHKTVTLIRRMVQDGLHPSIVSFNCLIAAHASAGSPFDGLTWLQRAAKWASDPTSSPTRRYHALMSRAFLPSLAPALHSTRVPHFDESSVSATCAPALHSTRVSRLSLACSPILLIWLSPFNVR